ncbi:MAG: alpha/beta hydrolase [Lautropia sp. SCN 70-15]|nr:MAG: alpha/beta hydrolase [Lautropia sp. SCN 70-15]
MSAGALASIDCGGRRVDIEYAWVGAGAPEHPVLVFLHEGLGSLSAWRDFPQRLCAALGLRGLVWSRAGYGRSTPREPGERWGPDFMHRQAREDLPALLETLGVDAPYLLFGHSDGGSIALIHAALHPARVAGLIVLAPHLFVEDLSVTSIEQVRQAYLATDLRARLARHHADPDSAFWGWNDVWLDPAFRDWTIEPLIARIAAPVLAIQGVDDEYGTMRQIDAIAAALPGTMLLKLDRCGHSPHRDRPDAVVEACEGFVRPIVANRAPARSL